MGHRFGLIEKMIESASPSPSSVCIAKELLVRGDGTFPGAPSSATRDPTQHQGAMPLVGHRSMSRAPSDDDWTVAMPTQIFFILLTVLAIPWFIARVLRRLGWPKGRFYWCGVRSATRVTYRD
jgi:hypothetical protein